MASRTILSRLIKSFSVVILIPSLLTAVVAVVTVRGQVYDQAQAQVTSDFEAAREIYAGYLDRLRNAVRIHATRRVVYGALEHRGGEGLAEEMERMRQEEGLDILTLLDAGGRVFHCTRNPARAGDDLSQQELVRRVLQERRAVASTEVWSGEQLAQEAGALVAQATMQIAPTPMAPPGSRSEQRSGMLQLAAAPVYTAEGLFVGVLLGGVLLNRNYEIVDKIRTTVFKQGVYRGRQVGTATIFQDVVRISTNVLNADGSRAITTQVSAEVAEAVLQRGETYFGRAFVVNDWYFSAYAPIRSSTDSIIGMLYVGILERPYLDALTRQLLLLLGIAIAGVALVWLVSIAVAQRISRPLRSLAAAAERVGHGDYSGKVAVTTTDEVGDLTARFNLMMDELHRARQELQGWAENLERKVSERTEELRVIQAQMLHAEKLAAIGKLAAGVAHEINNPLTAVLTNSSLLLQGLPDDEPSRADLQTIVDETLRCRRIVKGLLEFARQSKPQKQLLSLNQILGDVLALLRNQASFRNIAIETELDPELPAVMADADQVRQVCLNIVLNAAEAMPGGGRLQVATRRLPDEGAIEVEIADTGPGMDEQARGKIFEPFFTTKKTGTGLGLAIAYGIVEQHQGTIAVSSEPGRGTSFRVRLPRAG